MAVCNLMYVSFIHCAKGNQTFVRLVNLTKANDCTLYCKLDTEPHIVTMSLTPMTVTLHSMDESCTHSVHGALTVC